MTTPCWANHTMWTGDNLDIMRGMNAASVDIIYLDPPFNANHNEDAPNPKTQIVLASPLCAQASNPGAPV